MRSFLTSARLCGLGLVVLACLGVPARAQLTGTVSLSTSATAPTDAVISGNSSGGNLAWFWNSTSAPQRNLGEAFTTTNAFTLDSFTMQTFGTTSAGGLGFTVSLVTLPAGATGSNPITPSQTIANWTGTLPASASLTSTYLTFNVPDTLLSANTVYGIILSFNSENGSAALNFVEGSGGGYAGGTSFYGAGSPYTNQFEEFAFSANAVVPEPATLPLALLALAGLPAAALLRKKVAGSPAR